MLVGAGCCCWLPCAKGRGSVSVEILISTRGFFRGALPNFLDRPYTQVRPPAAHRPQRGWVLSQRTLAAPQASQDDRSLGGRLGFPLAFVEGGWMGLRLRELDMVTGGGVEEEEDEAGDVGRVIMDVVWDQEIDC